MNRFLTLFYCFFSVFALCLIFVPDLKAQSNSLLAENKIYGTQFPRIASGTTRYFSKVGPASPKVTLFTSTGRGELRYVDITHRKMYYLSGFSYQVSPPIGTLFRSDLDGSHMETGSAPIITNRPYNFLIPVGFDASREHLYYVGFNYGVVRFILRSNFNGSGATIVFDSGSTTKSLVKTSSFQSNTIITFDFVRRRMYFILDEGTDSLPNRFKLYRANLDGTNLVSIPINLDPLFRESVYTRIDINSFALDPISGDLFLAGRKGSVSYYPKIYRFKVSQWQPGLNLVVQPFGLNLTTIYRINSLGRSILALEQIPGNPYYIPTNRVKSFTLNNPPALMANYGNIGVDSSYEHLPYYSHCDPRFQTLSASFPTDFVNALTLANCDANGNDTSDFISPKITITSPSNTLLLSGTVSLAANVTDNIGVLQVDFLIANQIKQSFSAAPFTASLDTKTLLNGNHTFSVIARDAVGNLLRVNRIIQINNVTLP